jgi:hypothetical protein
MPICAISLSRTLSTSTPGTDRALLTKRGSERTVRTSACRVTNQAGVPSGVRPRTTGACSRSCP